MLVVQLCELNGASSLLQSRDIQRFSRWWPHGQQSAHLMLLYCSDGFLVFSCSWGCGPGVCVSCVEPWSKGSWVCLCVHDGFCRIGTGVPGQPSAADSAVNLGLASCPELGENRQYWGLRAKGLQNPHLCVSMVKKGCTYTRFGKSSVINSMD